MAEYLQLTIGRTRLLLPRSELLAPDAHPVPGAAGLDGSIGLARLPDSTLPLYRFNEHLQLQDTAGDGTHTGCVALAAGDGAYAVLCDTVEIIDDGSLQEIPLPVCMRTAGTPVRALALQGARILWISSAGHLLRLIPALAGSPDS